MKRLLIFLVGILMLTLSGCASGNAEEVDVTTLPYASYLSDTNPVVTITVKNVGEMKLQLFPDVAKNTVDNFINYIQDKSYSGSTFHRIIEDFMIQGGIVSDTNCSIEGEFLSNGISNNLSHYRGVISMARTSVKDSATSQFFIVHKDSTFLNGNYAAFGGLISGFNILDELAGVTTGYADAPTNEVVIKSITVDLNGYEPGDVICAN
jgi:peptidyl-prolyl cis-trans isomerase B (cyclophilin B)